VARLCKGLFYCSGDIDNPESYQLKDLLSELERETNENRMFYLL